ncbi:hypothetical protein ISR94_00680 [Candidatus Microgenomates bacterium]|nr:hypothetical protein [Candidatus Microgenomates bacterium]
MQNNNDDNKQQDPATFAPPIFPSPDDVTPPMTEELNQAETTNGSAAPTDDIVPPTVVTQPNTQENETGTKTKTGKKFGGGKGKFIATILGIFLLVGSIGAGVILVQQQQDIRERADPRPYEVANDGPGGINDPGGGSGSTGGGDSGDGGGSGGGGGSAPVTTPFYTDANGVEYTREEYQALVDADNAITENAERIENEIILGGLGGGGVRPGEGENCNIITNPCAQGFVCHSQGGDASTSEICEPVALEQSCEAQGRTWTENMHGRGMTCCVQGYVENPSDDGCVPGSGGSGGGITTLTDSAQCLNIKAYDINWSPLTSTQLSQLTVGDVVRFTAAGQSPNGTFTKARFTINGILRSEVATKKPSTTEFYDEYTIPAGISTFNIAAQVFHDSLGWK